MIAFRAALNDEVLAHLEAEHVSTDLVERLRQELSPNGDGESALLQLFCITEHDRVDALECQLERLCGELAEAWELLREEEGQAQAVQRALHLQALESSKERRGSCADAFEASVASATVATELSDARAELRSCLFEEQRRDTQHVTRISAVSAEANEYRNELMDALGRLRLESQEAALSVHLEQSLQSTRAEHCRQEVSGSTAHLETEFARLLSRKDDVIRLGQERELALEVELVRFQVARSDQEVRRELTAAVAQAEAVEAQDCFQQRRMLTLESEVELEAEAVRELRQEACGWKLRSEVRRGSFESVTSSPASSQYAKPREARESPSSETLAKQAALELSLASTPSDASTQPLSRRPSRGRTVHPEGGQPLSSFGTFKSGDRVRTSTRNMESGRPPLQPVDPIFCDIVHDFKDGRRSSGSVRRPSSRPQKLSMSR
uniref:Uncharacterized protein n=1 Tax=Noctiluca scintillans TaxID=2966 RepID=A0A7S1AFH4_NOCSC